MEELFRDVLWDCSTETDWLDSALVSRWMNGQAKLSPRIQEYYRQNKNKSKLCTGIETRLFPQMADCSMAVQEMHALLLGAPNVSRQKKEELTEGYPWPTENEQAVFLTELLCFAMEQNFVKRDIRQKQIAAGGAASPVVRDYIYSGEMPRPCKWFRGREAELARLHELLLEEGKVFLGGIPGIGKSELANSYLSGNGPLVAVLTEALAQDNYTKYKTKGEKKNLTDSRREVSKAIQIIHRYRDNMLAKIKNPVENGILEIDPAKAVRVKKAGFAEVEHVAIFDEAQRSWTQKRLADYLPLLLNTSCYPTCFLLICHIHFLVWILAVRSNDSKGRG